jgi:hypothetical protein
LFGVFGGYHAGMSESASDRVQERAAHLLPEERVAGSDDPEAQAEQILNDSDAREAFDESTSESIAMIFGGSARASCSSSLRSSA